MYKLEINASVGSDLFSYAITWTFPPTSFLDQSE